MSGPEEQPLDLHAQAELENFERAGITVGTIHDLIARGITSEQLLGMIPNVYFASGGLGGAFIIPTESTAQDYRYQRNHLLAPLLQRVELAELEGTNQGKVLQDIQLELSQMNTVDSVYLSQGMPVPPEMLNNRGVTLDMLALPPQAHSQTHTGEQ